MIIRKCALHTRGYDVESRPRAFLRFATRSGHVMLICCHSKSVDAVRSSMIVGEPEDAYANRPALNPMIIMFNTVCSANHSCSVVLDT